MKKSTAALAAYAAIAYFLYKKAGKLSGLDGLGEYPLPGSSPGYYSSASYSSWYTGTFVPWYFSTYRQYPPAYAQYLQQGSANLYSQDASGNQYINFDAPTPIQNRPQQYYQQQPNYYPFNYPQNYYGLQTYGQNPYQYPYNQQYQIQPAAQNPYYGIPQSQYPM